MHSSNKRFRLEKVGSCTLATKAEEIGTIGNCRVMMEITFLCSRLTI